MNEIPRCPRGENHIVGYGLTEDNKYFIGCASCTYGFVEENTRELAIEEFRLRGARKKLKELLALGDKPSA